MDPRYLSRSPLISLVRDTDVHFSLCLQNEEGSLNAARPAARLTLTDVPKKDRQD